MNTRTRRFLASTLAHTRISAVAEIEGEIRSLRMYMADSYAMMKFHTRHCDGDGMCCHRAEYEHGRFVQECLEEITMLERQLPSAERLDNEWIPDEWEPTLRHGWVAVW